MFIRSIKVQHWRGLDELVIEELSPHLNLVAGPNESGKSRLVQALRFALFESSRGKAGHKKDLQSWGGGAQKPQVTVSFDYDGVQWTLRKTFLTTDYDTHLNSSVGTFAGEDAELRLAQLLGVAPGGSRESKPEDRGIWSLLWVEQGDSTLIPTANSGAEAQAALQDRLAGEIGEVAAGPVGQRVLAGARERYLRYYTEVQGNEKGELAGLREALSAAQQALEGAQAVHAAVVDDADALQAARDRDASLSEAVTRARQDLDDVLTQASQAEEAQRELAQIDEQCRAAQRELEQQQRALEDATLLRSQAVALRQTLAETKASRQVAQHELAAAEAELDTRKAAVANADASWEASRARLTALRLEQQRRQLRTERAQLQTRSTSAQAVDARMRELRDALATAVPISAADVGALQQARQRLDEARAVLQGVATRLELHAARDLEIDGEPLAAGATRSLQIEDDRSIEIEGVGTLHVRPGGGELARLREALADAQRAWTELCARLQVAAVAEAELQLRARGEREAELGRLRDELAQLLPDGSEAVTARLAELDRQLEAEDEAAQVDGDLDTASTEHDAAEAARDTARAQRDVALERRANLASSLAVLDAQCQERDDRYAELDASVARLPAETEQQQAVAVAQQHWQQCRAARETAAEVFEALGGTRLDSAVQQARQALSNLEERSKTNQLDKVRLETRLEGAAGSFETLQDAAAERERVAAQLKLLERQALTADKLYSVLQSAHQMAQQRLAAPVIAAITPYLKDVFPGTEVWLDEQLQLQGLRGGSGEEAFGQLSGGAQEQLSLLVRLGLAEVLAGGDDGDSAGDGDSDGAASWPLVLDDVLVNTDPERIRRVQRALFDASRHVQILLLTCHGELFDALGAERWIELPARRR